MYAHLEHENRRVLKDSVGQLVDVHTSVRPGANADLIFGRALLNQHCSSCCGEVFDMLHLTEINSALVELLQARGDK